MPSLVKKPHDPFWDGPLTRKEAQAAFDKLGRNDAELSAMADTASILINYLCEKAGVKREDVDAYVEEKKVLMAVERERLRQEAAANA
jgi:hypothetical protein